MLGQWCWLLLLLLLLLLSLATRPAAHGFSISQHDSVVRIQKVESDDDWNALADIRFNEWIAQKNDHQGGTTKMTSRNAFRSATREIYNEERPRSILFLAKKRRRRRPAASLRDPDNGKEKDDEEVVVVGAAELSPYEVEMALCPGSAISALYVTDVVTDSQFRRQGIARAMMQEMEDQRELHMSNFMIKILYLKLSLYQESNLWEIQ